jgi:AraC family transcriptional regulator, transcriptional activator of the genes for pyochelin and ferripyochelin receptors
MMQLRMSSLAYGPIIFNGVVPAGLLGFVVPGSRAVTAQGVYGKILLQEIRAGEITILYNIYQLQRDIAIDFECSTGKLQTHIALKNDCQCHINGIGPIYLAEGQFNISNSPSFEGTHFLEQGKEYRTLHIIFPSNFSTALLPIAHHFGQWLANSPSVPGLLFTMHPWLTVPLKNTIENILHCTYANGLLQLYREAKAKEFICLCLTPGKHNEGTLPPAKLPRSAMALMHDARRMIYTNFNRPVSITFIARQTGINEFKLKTGFKKIFGISMFNYLIKTRMQAARNLLQETDKPIKEIAALTGYANGRSFINAFKKHFNDTPGSFRKN